MESMEMFNEILEDFKQSDLVSMKVEMPGIRLTLKRRSDLQNAPSSGMDTVCANDGSRSAASRQNARTDSGLSGSGRTGAVSQGSVDSSETAVSAASPAAAGGSANASENNTSPEAETIQCPLVGVFYSASSPGAEPFVREGQEVHKGDVLCIIEAMKAMNELKAPYDLKIRKVCAENGEMAEFHQVLFEVERC